MIIKGNYICENLTPAHTDPKPHMNEIFMKKSERKTNYHNLQ